MIPKRLRIGSNLCDYFTKPIKELTLNAVSNNVRKAGTPENIGFWSPDQFDIAMNCFHYKRVLFVPHKTGTYLSM